MLMDILLIGLLFCIINSFFIGYVIEALWFYSNLQRPKKYNVQTLILGTIEASIYFFLFYLFFNSLLSKQELLPIIGFWFSLKGASKIWELKSKKEETGERYNIFLIGNLMNVSSAFLTTYFLIYNLENIYSLGLPVFMLTILYFFIRNSKA